MPGLLLFLTPVAGSNGSRLRTLLGVQYAKRVAAVGPDEQESVLAFGYAGQGLLYVTRGLDLMTVHFEDDVPLLQSGVIRGAAGLHLLDHSPVKLAWSLDLVADIRRQVAESKTPAHLAATLS